MSWPTFREFAARWWEFRPSSVGVLVVTGLIVVGAAVLDLSVWLLAALSLAVAAAVTGLFAWLELANEAAERDATERAGEP